MQLTTLIESIPMFTEKLTSALTDLNMLSTCHSLHIDHICIRLNTIEAVDTLKAELLTIGFVISQAKINGRDIYIIELNTPLSFGNWIISAIELPYPKQNSNYIEGWEHVEFVLPHASNTLGGIKTAFFTSFPHLHNVDLAQLYEFKIDTPSAEVDQLPNPTVALKHKGVGIKFHAQSIQKVVGFSA